jgi:hypothetical protein
LDKKERFPPPKTAFWAENLAETRRKEAFVALFSFRELSDSKAL